MDIYTRKIDGLHRVVIPQRLLDDIDVEPGGLIDFTCEGGCISIEKSAATCRLCGTTKYLVEVDAGEQSCLVCSMCATRIQVAVIRRLGELEEWA